MKSIKHFLLVLVAPLIPYESSPQQPEEDLPEEAGMPADEQLAQCQTIFDETEARRAHIEQKAQWAFTVIAFLVPSLASVFAFLLHGTLALSESRAATLLLLALSATLLLLSFIAAIRALAIRRREFLYLDSVINSETGFFKKYDKALHAQGLLYCANVNTATNDHVAQFVKSAHLAMFSAVIVFSLAAATTGFQMTSQRMDTPTKTELVGTVSLSPDNLSTLGTDIHDVSEALTIQASSSDEQKLKVDLALHQLSILETKVDALQKQISAGTSDKMRARPTSPAHNNCETPPTP